MLFFFSSRRRHTRLTCDWSSDVCSSDLNTICRKMKKTSSGKFGGRSEAHAELPAAGLLHLPADGVRDDGLRADRRLSRGGLPGQGALHVRSEERRVGKECRSRWWWEHCK